MEKLVAGSVNARMDSSMATDRVSANFEQIFVTYSPGTVRKVL